MVFIMAAIPLIEISVVIPVAIATGLSPVWVMIVAFVGNTLPVLIIIVVYEKSERWWAERQSQKSKAHERQEGSSEITSKTSKRRARARKIWDLYGLPGLSLLAPALTGVHLVVVMALAFKCPKLPTAIWMTISLALWSLGLGVLSFYGLVLFGRLWPEF